MCKKAPKLSFLYKMAVNVASVPGINLKYGQMYVSVDKVENWNRTANLKLFRNRYNKRQKDCFWKQRTHYR